MPRHLILTLALLLATDAHALDTRDRSESPGAPSAGGLAASELRQPGREQDAESRASARGWWASLRASIRVNDFTSDARMRDLGFRDARLVHYGLD